MPFWWKRRRRPWFGRFRYKRRKTYRRRRRRFPRRRRYRKTTRRRRRRKVRRKLKKITIKQWQPDSITKCKIKGFSCLVLGANGRQMFCYTNVADQYTIAKSPGGGGFGCELITLKWLYDQYTAHNNIWTKTNQYKDLVRYTGCTITVFRHPYVDFILQYHLQGPFTLNKYTYPELHPQNALLARHKRIILSRANAPNKRQTVKIKIKPPKLMSTKWFFQKEFCEYPLVQLCATAVSFSFPRIQPNAQNQIITLYALNPSFYFNSNWKAVTTEGYKNITTQKYPLFFDHSIRGIPSPYEFNPNKIPEDVPAQLKLDKYLYSVSYRYGLFSPQVMTATKVYTDKQNPEKTKIANLPLIVLRYNPNVDDGYGNEIYLTSIHKGHYDKPTVTPDYIFQGVPLWMGLYGYGNYLIQSSKDKGLLTTHMFICKSRALHPISQATKDVYYPIINTDFAFGKLPYDEYITSTMKSNWYPTGEMQEDALNNIVMTGPYQPKFNNITNSTWELDYKYQFFFKWGGPYTTDPVAEDPCKKGTYPTLSALQQTIQIKNPEKLSSESMLHDWDFRRGIVTATALKRMSENLETDTSFESDDSETPKKKKKISKEMPCHNKKEEKIHECLLSLCEEPTCQETPQTLEQLIQQQQQQQQQLKRNLLRLFQHLKHGQQQIQLQTGVLE
uniref:Capsid protein n=1 Tax=Gammatorquevirus 001A TaxID=3163413 RepID=A0AAU7SSW2_9VIRU